MEARFANIDWEEDEEEKPAKRVETRKSSPPAPKRSGSTVPTPTRTAKSDSDPLDIRYFELVDDVSNKYWQIKRWPTYYEVHYGRIGTTGQTTIKRFSSDLEAYRAYLRIVREKIDKGYIEKANRRR